jgi:hypothetical protein
MVTMTKYSAFPAAAAGRGFPTEKPTAAPAVVTETILPVEALMVPANVRFVVTDSALI